MLLVAMIALAAPMAVAQDTPALQPTGVEAAPGTQVETIESEIERLTFEVRQAMSARRWSAAVTAADALLLVDPGNSTARVQKEQAERQIAMGIPEGISPTPSPTPTPTPVAVQTPEAAVALDAVPQRPLTSGGETPVELIFAAIGAAVLLIAVVWFFFFARKRPAERRMPAAPATPIVSRPISPYGKAKVTEPAKDENLIQYGSVGQLNQPAVDAEAPVDTAKPKTPPRTEDAPTVREMPVEPPPKLEMPPAPKLPVAEADTEREESTPAILEASHPAIPTTEPAPVADTDPKTRPVLSPPVSRDLQILQVDLESVEIAPAAPPTAGDAGPDVESLPTIKLSDAPVAAAPTPEPEETPVGADLPVIAFDASVPLDLGAPTGGEAALAAITEASLPSIKMSEDAFHFGGADEIGLNDLPDLRGDLGEPTVLPSLRLTDTPLEELEKMINGGKQEAANAGGGDGVRSIKMVDG